MRQDRRARTKVAGANVLFADYVVIVTVIEVGEPLCAEVVSHSHDPAGTVAFVKLVIEAPAVLVVVVPPEMTSVPEPLRVDAYFIDQLTEGDEPPTSTADSFVIVIALSQ